MRRLVGAAALVATTGTAIAADVALCKLSDDKRTVTVVASNPYSQPMSCEVNCDMAIPDGILTVVCVKQVPVGAKDFVMCSEVAKDGRSWTRVKGTEANCPDPAAAAKPAPKDADDEDDDADALIQKLQKQGQDFIERHRGK
jgi:hypothetical protein